MGDVVAGRCPISLNAWIWYSERDSILDFVPTTKENFILAMIPKRLEVDFTLYLRPFRVETWYAVLPFMVIGLLGIVLNQFIAIRYKALTFKKIFMFTFWSYFLLIHAHYGGALKMFFATQVAIPFETLGDVLQESPDWTIVVVKGNEAYFKLQAEKV